MKFNVVAVDPARYPRGHWQRDLARLLVGGLESAGHSCSLSRNFPERDRLNLVVGGQLIRGSEHLASFIEGSAPYIVVQTERLLGPELAIPENAAVFESSYLPVLKGAAAIWDLQPARVKVIEALGLQGSYLPLGFDPCMRVWPSRREQNVDFTFFGSITQHRQALLAPLQQAGRSLQVIRDEDPFFRNDVLARTRVHLAPRRGDGTGRIAVTRLATVLANGGLVVLEAGVDHHGLEDCVLLAPTAEWVAECLETLDRDDREELARALSARFQERRMADCLAPLLEGLS